MHPTQCHEFDVGYAKRRCVIKALDSGAGTGRMARGYAALMPATTERCCLSTTAWSASFRYWYTFCAAPAPSPTAEAKRFIDPKRTSPTANTPGTLVSKLIGFRCNGQALKSTSCPVTIKPLASRL